MSKIISEENPEAKEQSSNAPESGGGTQDKLRKEARQLAYDTRYKVKGQFKDGQKTDAANLKKAYMSQLGKSPAPGPVKQLAKKMLVDFFFWYLVWRLVICGTIWAQMSAWKLGTRGWEVGGE